MDYYPKKTKATTENEEEEKAGVDTNGPFVSNPRKKMVKMERNGKLEQHTG